MSKSPVESYYKDYTLYQINEMWCESYTEVISENTCTQGSIIFEPYRYYIKNRLGNLKDV